MDNNDIFKITSSVIEDLKNEKLKINDLEFEKATNRKAVFEFLKDNPSKLKKLKSENEKKFLKYCIERKFDLFVYLNPEQYEEELCKLFLTKKIEKQTPQNVNFMYKSFNGNIVFDVAYQTFDGEQVFYFDKELQVSTFLVAKILTSFKILDTANFIKMIDVDVCDVGYNTILDKLTNLINNAYRKVIIAMIKTQNLGVFKINSSYLEIETEIKNELNLILKNGGAEVDDIRVSKISVTDDTSLILEKQSLEILNERRKKEADIDYERKSLENYEKKAEIHSKYPDFANGLTEAEKDFAFERYVRKIRAENGESPEELLHNRLLGRNAKNADDKIKKLPDKLPIFKKDSSFSWVLILSAIILFIVSFVKLSDGMISTFLILFGLAILSLGSYISLVIYKQDKNKKYGTGASSLEDRAILEEEYQDKLKQGEHYE